MDQVTSEKSCAPSCQTLNEIYGERRGCAIVESSFLKQNSSNIVSIPSEHPKDAGSQVDGYIRSDAPCLTSSGKPEDAVLSSDLYASNMNTPGEGSTTVHNPVDFGSLLQVGYIEGMQHNGSNGLTKDSTVDVASNNNDCEGEKLGKDVEDDEMFGGMFAFSEEGTKLIAAIHVTTARLIMTLILLINISVCLI